MSSLSMDIDGDNGVSKEGMLTQLREFDSLNISIVLTPLSSLEAQQISIQSYSSIVIDKSHLGSKPELAWNDSLTITSIICLDRIPLKELTRHSERTSDTFEMTLCFNLKLLILMF